MNETFINLKLKVMLWQNRLERFVLQVFLAFLIKQSSFPHKNCFEIDEIVNEGHL
jgi:hypothetical protein